MREALDQDDQRLTATSVIADGWLANLVRESSQREAHSAGHAIAKLRLANPEAGPLWAWGNEGQVTTRLSGAGYR